VQVHRGEGRGRERRRDAAAADGQQRRRDAAAGAPARGRDATAADVMDTIGARIVVGAHARQARSALGLRLAPQQLFGIALIVSAVLVVESTKLRLASRA
jgi:hypothetical protein